MALSPASSKIAKPHRLARRPAAIWSRETLRRYEELVNARHPEVAFRPAYEIVPRAPKDAKALRRCSSDLCFELQPANRSSVRYHPSRFVAPARTPSRCVPADNRDHAPDDTHDTTPSHEPCRALRAGYSRKGHAAEAAAAPAHAALAHADAIGSELSSAASSPNMQPPAKPPPLPPTLSDSLTNLKL